MKLLNLALLCAAVLFCSTIAKAQSEYPDYVIKMNGDTIKNCRVYWKIGGGQIYKTPPKDKSVKIKPDSVKEFCMIRLNYTNTFKSVLKAGSTSRIFMQAIEKGKIDLFEEVKNSYSPGIAVSVDNLYVAKQTDTVQFIKTDAWIASGREKRKDILANMLKDNKPVYDQYTKELGYSNGFSFNTIQKLIHLYNTGRTLEADQKAEAAKAKQRLKEQQEKEEASRDGW